MDADQVATTGESGASQGLSPFEGAGELEAARAAYARRLARRGGLPELNRLANLAARLLGAGSAQVSLISEVQTVVGGAGAAAGLVGGDSASEDSLCTVTVTAAGALRVDDAVHDDRVAHLPPVKSGEVGSYLGVPLTAAGHVVGALCVFDEARRPWTDDDVALLEALATPVVTELELAALETEYEGDRLVWELAVDAGGVGAFDWNLATGELRFDERLLELFGLDRSAFGSTIDAFYARLHPGDRERVAEALTQAVNGSAVYSAEYRVLLPDGSTRWLRARGRAIPGPDGQAVRVLGAATDTTAVQDEEARVARVLESMATGFFHLDPQWRFTYANAEARRLLGGIDVEIVGGVVWELFPAAVGTEFETRYRHAMETGEPVTFEAYYPAPLEAWYEVRALPSPDGLSVYFLEVTERRAAQQVLEQSHRRATVLADVTEALSGTLDAEEAVARLAQLVVPQVGDWCLVTLADGALAGGTAADTGDWRRHLRDVGCWHVDPAARDLVRRYSRARIPALSDTSFVTQVLRRGEPVVLTEHAAESVAAVLEDEGARDMVRQLDPWSAVYVPLLARGRTVGQLCVFRGRERPPIGADELSLLQEVAGRAGLALDNARLYAEQRDLAAGLQRSMLTAPPEPDHLQVAVRYVPAAEAAQVGGDWYDAFLQPDGSTMVVIGDVVGHDTASAAAMGQLRSILRAIAVTTAAGPGEVLQRVDHVLSVLLLETTATAVVARFEQTPEERREGLTRMLWSNAGHPPPIVVEHSGPGAPPAEPGPLWGAGPDLLLGMLPNATRREAVTTLRRGSTVLLYTDGLVERRGQNLDEGLDLLTSVFADLVHAGHELEETCDQLLARMLPDRPDDDVALVAVRLHPEDRPRPPEAGPTCVPPEVDEPTA